jgi:hypothetical protein
MLTTPLKTSLSRSFLILLFAILYGKSFAQTQPPCTLACTDITKNTDPGKCGAIVTYNFTSGDCGTVTSSHPSGSFFPVGATTVNVSTTTGQKCSFTVRVNDVEKPVISSVTATPNELWSPNHKMVPVAIKIVSSDNCGIAECKIIGITSNEPVNGLGDGDTEPDWQIVDNTHVNLRAERSGTGNGRIYTITVQCTDTHRNSSTATVTVRVPHDMSKENDKKINNDDKVKEKHVTKDKHEGAGKEKKSKVKGKKD